MFVRLPPCCPGITLCMSCYCRVDVICKVVVSDELWVVEVRVVGGKEEDAGNKEFVIGAVALWSSQYTKNSRFRRMLVPSASLPRAVHGQGLPVFDVSWAAVTRHWLCTAALLVTWWSLCLRKHSGLVFESPRFVNVSSRQLSYINSPLS